MGITTCLSGLICAFREKCQRILLERTAKEQLFYCQLCCIPFAFANPNLSANSPHLKIVHAVGKRDHKAGVVVDGLVTENDVHAVVEIPEIVLGRGQLAAVVLWVVPARRESRTIDQLRYRMCTDDNKRE